MTLSNEFFSKGAWGWGPISLSLFDCGFDLYGQSQSVESLSHFALALESSLTTNYQYLIRLLQEETAQTQAELDSIRNSLRYRAGSLLVEAFPPSRRSFSALRGLLCLFLQQVRSDQAVSTTSSLGRLPEAALNAETLVFTDSASIVGGQHVGAWITSDAFQLAAVLDETQRPGILVLQQLDQIVLRRLGRWQALGGRVVWQPLPGEAYPPVLLGYLQSLLGNPTEIDA